MNKALEKYLSLLKEVDRLCTRSKCDYEPYISCRAGCGECCTNISIFPVEWYAMEKWLEKHPELIPSNREPAGTCLFLKNNSCSVYEIRSLICRTHGYPLVYLAEEYLDASSENNIVEPDVEFTWCEYNFTGVGQDNIAKVLNMESVINMEDLNTRLAELNFYFLDTAEGARYSETRRYTINELLLDWLSRTQAGSGAPGKGSPW